MMCWILVLIAATHKRTDLYSFASAGEKINKSPVRIRISIYVSKVSSSCDNRSHSTIAQAAMALMYAVALSGTFKREQPMGSWLRNGSNYKRHSKPRNGQYS